MKERGFIRINRWLLPLSWLYGAAVRLRNCLFDWGVLKSRTFDVPVICVGNLTVGGTGKTPHVEYLIRLLQTRTKVAVLSRGYKRKTSGYILASQHTTQQDIGDEPYQMKGKFPDIHVAVCADRCEGIDRLTTDQQTSDTGVVLLDDAFQHRYVKPALSILLIDYNRLVEHDAMLPAGRLREPASGKKRAQIIIVTKCPQRLMPLDYRVLQKSVAPYPFQTLFFTRLCYGQLCGIYNKVEKPLSAIHGYNVLLLTGIASPQQMIGDLKEHQLNITPLTFPDHHDFTTADEQLIEQTFQALPHPRIIITTEKDATRMEQFQHLSADTREATYQLPITIEFLQDQQQSFNEKILTYVRKDSTDSTMAQAKTHQQSKDSHHPRVGSRTISFRNN